MADITKCYGIGCPIKESCHRFLEKPNKYYQSYFKESPFKNNHCDMYWGKEAQNIWKILKEITK